MKQGGRITYVGSLAGALRAAGVGARRVNLRGRTLLPGFIDTHGHFIYFGKNLIDADLFGVASIAELRTGDAARQARESIQATRFLRN